MHAAINAQRKQKDPGRNGKFRPMIPAEEVAVVREG